MNVDGNSEELSSRFKLVEDLSKGTSNIDVVTMLKTPNHCFRIQDTNIQLNNNNPIIVSQSKLNLCSIDKTSALTYKENANIHHLYTHTHACIYGYIDETPIKTT